MPEFTHTLMDRVTGTSRYGITQSVAYPFGDPPTATEVYTVTTKERGFGAQLEQAGQALVARLALAKAHARGLHSRPNSTAPILISQGMYGALLVAVQTRNLEEIQKLLDNVAQIPDYDGVLARMVKALEWYADAGQNYVHTDSTPKPTQVMKDGGKRAREALEYAGLQG